MPRGTQWHRVVRLRSKSYAMPQVYVDIVLARWGMPFDATRPKNSISKLSVPSKEAARHMMNKRFQNGISQFEKKIRPSSPISSWGNRIRTPFEWSLRGITSSENLVIRIGFTWMEFDSESDWGNWIRTPFSLCGITSSENFNFFYVIPLSGIIRSINGYF